MQLPKWISRLPFFCIALCAGCASSNTPAATTPAPRATVASPGSLVVTGADAKKLIADGARLVDVRSPEEFADKHIPGAENVPVDAIVGGRDIGDSDKPLVVYCGSGKRAARAAESLRSRGYTRVYELGAMSNWDK